MTTAARQPGRRRRLAALRTDSDECEFKMFDPNSQTFVNAINRSTPSASSSSLPLAAATAASVLDPVSKFPRFQFVNVDSRRPRSPRYESAARAHVMRRVRKDQDEARRCHDAAIRNPKLAGPASSVSLLHTADMSHIQHYIQSFAKSFLPMSHPEETWWFLNALNDEACYHSMLFASQVHQALLTGRDHTLGLNYYRHKGEALKHINKRLCKPGEPPDDATVVAIACLAAHENFFGSREIATVHTGGLVTIHNLRRGFHGTDNLRFLERLVHWIELSNATAARQKSEFVSQDLLMRDTFEIACAGSTTLIGSSNKFQSEALATFQVYKGMTPTAAAIFRRLRQLSHIRAQVQSVRDLEADKLYLFAEEVSLLERHINTILSKDTGLDCSQAEQCLPLYGAALAFIYAAFRDVPVLSPIFDNFTERSKRSLERMGFETFCQHFSLELLLWLLFCMTWIAQGHQNRRWYFTAITWLTWQLRLCRWEQVKEILGRYCMVDSVCESPFRKLWIELGHQL